MKTTNNSQLFMIVAKCDPYNARFHHGGERVLKRDGMTPVEWVHDDCFGRGYTKAEALKLLEGYANEKTYLSYFDSAYAREWWKAMREENPNLKGRYTDWYKGKGWYQDGFLRYKKGDDFFEDDVMTYSIEELIPEEPEEDEDE